MISISAVCIRWAVKHGGVWLHWQELKTRHVTQQWQWHGLLRWTDDTRPTWHACTDLHYNRSAQSRRSAVRQPTLGRLQMPLNIPATALDKTNYGDVNVLIHNSLSREGIFSSGARAKCRLAPPSKRLAKNRRWSRVLTVLPKINSRFFPGLSRTPKSIFQDPVIDS